MKTENNIPVISSRIRLARNIKDYPFPMMLLQEEGSKIINEVSEIFKEQPNISGYKINVLNEMNHLNRLAMVEKHLMSPALLNDRNKSALIVSPHKEISIMINEEDHIRIQCIKSGFQLEDAFSAASQIDDVLEDKLEYVFDEKLGFLTSCPTNVGTGLRASVMMHLPGLRMIGELTNMIQTISKLGLTVRGVYGEGSEALGNMFQISNQVTLGASEPDIIKAVKKIIIQIIEKENKARALLLSKDKIYFEDKVYRSYGLLKNARLLNYKESMRLISDVILGVDVGIITETNAKTLHHMIQCVQPASLQILIGEDLDERERSIKRAELIGDIIR